MAEPSSEPAPSPEAPSAKKGMGKIVAVIVAIVLIIVAIGAWYALQPTTPPPPPPPPVNRAPTINSVSASHSARDVGLNIAFTVDATDPDAGDTLNYSWNFGDGSAAGTLSTLSHAFAIGGSFIAVVSVEDGHAHTVTSEASPIFLFINHPETRAPPTPSDTTDPVAVLSADRALVQVNNLVTLNGNSSWTYAYDPAINPDTGAPYGWTFNDAASNESAITTLAWNFGDGTTASGNATQVGQVTKAWTSTGIKAVQLTVTNQFGLTDTVGYTVLVTPSTPPATGVKNPDIFTEVRFGEPEHLDPAVDYETSGGQVIQNVLEGLIFYNREFADRYIPMLAARIPDPTNPADVSPDGMTWNFTLKSGVTFHSGNPVTCAAVEFSIERVLVFNDGAGPAWILDQSLTGYFADDGDPTTPPSAARLAVIQNSVLCPDGPTGLRVQFQLAIPYPAFLATLAFTAAYVIDPSPAAYRVTSLCPSTDLMSSYCDDQLVGTGPYKLRVWQPNQQIILDRFDNYHRALGNFQEVHIVKANDVATRVLMLKAGDADYIDLPPSHQNDIRDTGGALLPGITEAFGDTFVVQFLGFNQNINVAGAPPGDVDVPADFFRDVNIRKAFSYAWKYTDFINNVLYGYGTPLCGPIPAGMFGYDATTPCYSFDLDQTEAFLRQALDPRTPSATDTYWDNGFTITIYYNIGNLVREEGARQLAQTFSDINTQRRSGLPPINVRAQGLEWATFLTTVSARIPAMFFLGWAPDYADPDDYVVPFLRTGQFYPNRVGYSNTTLDALIDQQSQELDQPTRLALLSQIQLAPYNDVPYIWLYQSQNYDAMRSWVTGYYSNPMTTAGTGLYYYDLDK